MCGKLNHTHTHTLSHTQNTSIQLSALRSRWTNNSCHYKQAMTRASSSWSFSQIWQSGFGTNLSDMTWRPCGIYRRRNVCCINVLSNPTIPATVQTAVVVMPSLIPALATIQTSVVSMSCLIPALATIQIPVVSTSCLTTAFQPPFKYL